MALLFLAPPQYLEIYRKLNLFIHRLVSRETKFFSNEVIQDIMFHVKRLTQDMVDFHVKHFDKLILQNRAKMFINNIHTIHIYKIL